ncbi:NUDIX hydrolase [Nocardioides seonyuensis]|uniref:NUDIX hydrolase n=1 Tax=Nocardioides seonyuensis TaxID=2518371 RepID=A0A4P7IGD2_9ACTN|nr:NUDIX hydrolase [Nocardioides seonyuensis]QBX55820.1 NUDIX hydrolase [Nocardioides seonyuensis]
MEPRDVRAAGAVVTRSNGDVVLVHRPKYDDWSFPKGKVDPGEHVVATAVREVAEETGLGIRLGPPLSAQRYRLEGGRIKHVDYWVARVVGDDDVTRYPANDEIDLVEWLPWDEAAERLTHQHDRETLAQARPLRRRTRAVVVLRHAKARSRKSWTDDDRLRPLLQVGVDQAARLVPVLAAFGVTAVHCSSSRRCVDTVRPYADATGLEVHLHDELSEEDASVEGVLDLVDEALQERAGVVLCSHRPVLPTILDALCAEDATLEVGELLVQHRRKGRVVATERHLP